MQYARVITASDGTRKYIVVGTSTRHNACPPIEGVIRAKLDLFGWVIEPVPSASSKKSEGPRCKVSYMVQVDFGGRVPSQLLNTISFQQPLCVHYLQKYIQTIREKHVDLKAGNISAATSKASFDLPDHVRQVILKEKESDRDLAKQTWKEGVQSDSDSQSSEASSIPSGDQHSEVSFSDNNKTSTIVVN